MNCDNKEPKNRLFYTVNMHGKELEYDYTVPDGCRVIMFCYSGKILDICPKFDKFNWKLFTDPDVIVSYCTFLERISKYSSIRNHFCVYNSGEKIQDILFTPDQDFKYGIYKLPVQGAVYDENSNTVYVSDPETTGLILTNPELSPSRKSTHIAMNPNKTASLLRYRENKSYIHSPHMIVPRIKLSELLRNLKVKYGGCTLLLLTCREGKGYEIPDSHTVLEEIKSLFQEQT